MTRITCAAYWYCCQDPQGYYRWVKDCPGGWMKVVPAPAPPRNSRGYDT
jgi:hypothetical protein